MVSENSRPMGLSRDSCALRRAILPWLQLLAGLALILLFMFVIAPLAYEIPAFQTFSERIDERNLRSTAIFYTDLEESGEGSSYIRDSLEYPPRDE